MSHLIEPHGGQLVDLLASPERAEQLKEESREWESWDLTPRQLCDLELLMVGAFSPLDGFMTKDDCDGVCSSMRLADGTLWPIPITLDITEEAAEKVAVGDRLALRDAEGIMLAAIEVEQMWEHDPEAEAEAVYGTRSEEHPGVAHLLHRTNNVAVAGRVEGLQLPLETDQAQVQLRRRRDQ